MNLFLGLSDLITVLYHLRKTWGYGGWEVWTLDQWSLVASSSRHTLNIMSLFTSQINSIGPWDVKLLIIDYFGKYKVIFWESTWLRLWILPPFGGIEASPKTVSQTFSPSPRGTPVHYSRPPGFFYLLAHPKLLHDPPNWPSLTLVLLSSKQPTVRSWACLCQL